MYTTVRELKHFKIFFIIYFLKKVFLIEIFSFVVAIFFCFYSLFIVS